MKKIVLNALEESIEVKRHFISNHLDLILEAAEMLVHCIASGHKVLIFGNGGSAADAQHIAAEFVNRFQIERPPLAAIALTTDASILTSIGNDYHFDDIFSKQIMALGHKNDIAWGISTSGNSASVVNAILTAREKGLQTIGLTGGHENALARNSDLTLGVNSVSTARIQECHITIAHILCDLVERTLFPQSFHPVSGEIQ